MISQVARLIIDFLKDAKEMEDWVFTPSLREYLDEWENGRKKTKIESNISTCSEIGEYEVTSPLDFVMGSVAKLTIN